MDKTIILIFRLLLLQISYLYAICTKKHNLYMQRLDVQIITSRTVSVGYMSGVACAGKCSELGDKCCKATYIRSTNECRIGLTGCCTILEEPAPGASVLQLKPTNEESLADPLVVSNGVDIGTWMEEDYCNKGHYAIGYKIKGEHFKPDYTGTNIVEIICGSKVGYSCDDSVSSGNGLWVDYERHILCPQKTFMESFSIQAEEYKGPFADNSGPNWFKFRCRDLHSLTSVSVIEATNTDLTYLRGVYGNWSDSCPLGTAICGIQTRILAAQFLGDDIALTDAKFFCCF